LKPFTPDLFLAQVNKDIGFLGADPRHCEHTGIFSKILTLPKLNQKLILYYCCIDQSYTELHAMKRGIP
jgi:hypothetical protein